MDFQLFKWSQKRWLPNETIKKTRSGQTQTISAAVELLVFYSRSVIYFKKAEDKEQIYPFGMTKEGSGTDTHFITSRQI